jgi:hypothetical protein
LDPLTMLVRDTQSGYYYIDASADNPNICVMCIKMNIEALLSEDGFRRLLIRAQSCHICEAVYQAAFSNHKGHVFGAMMRQMVSLRLDVERSQLYFRHVLWDETIDKQRTYIEIQVFTESGRIYPRLSSPKLIFPGDVAVGLGVPLQKELSNTSSPETFEFIKSCLRKCQAKHLCSDVVVNGSQKTDFGRPLNPVVGPFRALPKEA